MVEDEGRQRQRIFLDPEAEFLAEGVLQTEAGDRCRRSIAGLLRLFGSSSGLCPKRAGGGVEHREVIGAGETGLIGNAILDVRPCNGLHPVGELRHGYVLTVELAVERRVRVVRQAVYFTRRGRGRGGILGRNTSLGTIYLLWKLRF